MIFYLLIGNTVGKVITSNDFYIIEHSNDSVRSIAVEAFAVSVDPSVTGANQRFAEAGDSGSLVIEYTNLENPKVYGMVWQSKPVKSEIQGEGVDPNAIICVKTEKCLRLFDRFFATRTKFQCIPMTVQVNYVEELGVDDGLQIVPLNA